MTYPEDPDYTGKAPRHKEAKLRSTESMSKTRILPNINKTAIFDEAIAVLLSSNVIKISPENIASLLSDKELKDKEKEEKEQDEKEEKEEQEEREKDEKEEKEESEDDDDKDPDDKDDDEPEEKNPKQKTVPPPIMPTFEQMKKAIESILKTGNKTEDELTADLKEYFHRVD